jgi:hypothetical protein
MEKVPKDEPRWHAGLAVAGALVLYVTLPPKLIIGPVWVLPLVLLLILLPLMIVSPRRHQELPWQRALSIVHIAVLNGFNVATIIMLFSWQLSIRHHKHLTGEELLVAAIQIWLTNIIVYALWFWELDGLGPEARTHTTYGKEPLRADFLFPQMAFEEETRLKMNWKPQFVDYLFLAFTNATAFSPADTFPLTRFAKVLMMAESLTSLVTISIIAGRAVGILGS